MIYIYSSKKHVGLESLASALGAERLWRFDGESFWDKSRKYRIEVPERSVVIPWGEELPTIEGLRVLNGRDTQFNRYRQWQILANSVKIARAYQPEPGDGINWSDSYYLGRKFGQSLTKQPTVPVAQADYFVERKKFTMETVIHSFMGRSIRAGIKVPMPGRSLTRSEEIYDLLPMQYVHPWIRSHAMGWEVDYKEGSLPETRVIAHTAIKVLGLIFGEVRLGKTDEANGQWMVISVSLAPNLRGLNAVKVYTKAITNLLEEPTNAIS